MRNLVLSSLVLGLTLLGTQNGVAQNSLWANYSTNEMIMLDRVAADFFQSSLRLSQSRKIEAATLEIYLAKSPEDRNTFREERRRVWKTMSDDQRLSARNVKLPVFSNLTESQKSPFRQIAIDQLVPASSSAKSSQTSAYSGGDV